MRFETDRFGLDTLRDMDGSAVMIHAGADNFGNIPPRYAPHGPDQLTRIDARASHGSVTAGRPLYGNALPSSVTALTTPAPTSPAGVARSASAMLRSCRSLTAGFRSVVPHGPIPSADRSRVSPRCQAGA